MNNTTKTEDATSRGASERPAPRRRLQRLSVVTAAGVAAATLSAPALGHDRSYPTGPSCVQAAEAGFALFLTSSVTGGAVIGGPCRFTSTAGGGYRSVSGNWRVAIDSLDGGRRVLSSANGDPPCGDGVIAPGDRVEIAAEVAIAAGANVGCGTAP